MEFGKPLVEQINERFSTNFSDSFGGDLSGYRSPTNYFNNNNGVGSPSQNRSVREIEEQMTTLRKENFNLKLRIYFLEEKMPELYRMSSPEGQESLMKKFVDNKVEIEILSKDLEDKQQLLKEAGEAITHMENVQKDTETRYKQIIEELNQKIQCLEFENESLENCSKNDEMIMNELIGRSNIDNNKVDMMQKIRELEGYVKEADEKITNLNHHIKNLEEINQTKEKTINDYDKDLKDSNFEKNELNEQLESKEKTLIETEKKLFKMEYDFNELKKKDKQVNNLEELVETLKFENRKLKNDFETQKIVAEENHATIKEQQLALNDMKSSLARKRKTIVHLSEKLKDSEKDCIKNQRYLEKEIDELRTILQNFKESQKSYDFHNRKNKSDKLSKKSQTTTTTATTLNYNRSYFWNPLFNASSSNININIPSNNTEKFKYFEDYRLKEKVSVYFNNYNNNINNNNNKYCNNINNNNTKNKDAEINNKHRNIKNISKKLKLNFKENNLKILYNKNDRFKDCISLDDFNNDESAAIAAAATAAAASNQNNFNILQNDQLTTTNTSSILLNNSKYNFGIPSLFTQISTAVRGTKSESNITDFSYFYDKNFYSFCYETEFDKKMTEINNTENCFSSSLNSTKYKFKNTYINNNNHNNNELQIMNNGIDNEIDYPKIFDDEYLRKQISSEFKVNFTSYGKLLIQVIIITIFLVGLSALSSKNNNSHQ